MLNVTDLRAGVVFEDNNEIFQVLSYEHIKMGRGGGIVKVKVKNLKSGSIVSKSFNTGAKVEDVSVSKIKAQYLYKDAEKFHFMQTASFEQFEIAKELLQESLKFLKEGIEISVMIINDQPVSIELPKSVDLKVAATGGSDRGNTVGASYKEAELENGLIVKVPLFIRVGETIKVDTKNSQYVERAK